MGRTVWRLTLGEGDRGEEASGAEAMVWGPRSESTVFFFFFESVCALSTHIANILCLVGSFLFCFLRGIWEMSAHFLTTMLLMPWVILLLIQFVLLLELRETGKLISVAAVCQWLS